MGSTRPIPEQVADQLLHQTVSSYSVVFFSFFFHLHEHFDRLKTPMLTRCPTLLPFARVAKLFVP